MIHKPEFHNSLSIWILCCRILGLFPYRISDHRIVKSEYHDAMSVNCLLFYSGAELLFMVTFKSRFPNFGLFILAAEFVIIFLWIIFGVTGNNRLITTLSLFDEFDRSFEMNTGRNIGQKKIYQTPTVRIMTFIFMCDYFIMMILALRTRSFGESIYISLFRTIQRTIILSFLLIYLHLVYSLKIRFKMLKEIWGEQVEAKVQNILFHSSVIVKIGTIRLMYNQLLNIIESINDAFGPRFVILYIQIFYRVLKYFYISCTGLSHVAWLQIYPLCIILMTTLAAQNLSVSADITPQLLRLPTGKTPDRLLLQVYGFLQQLRTSPLQMNAAGFFIINQKLLNTLCMALASYLVAIFQLAPLMERLGKRTTYGIL